ncbi:MAG: hypothetical protein JSS83_22235 [Cyanobacteria bacterium SZAS LIN-3]|nr:hypothetical protein [Cyanobacteria bacterium SZAS LIN-3]
MKWSNTLADNLRFRVRLPRGAKIRKVANLQIGLKLMQILKQSGLACVLIRLEHLAEGCKDHR